MNRPTQFTLLAILALAACDAAETRKEAPPRAVVTTTVGSISAATISRFGGELRAVERASLSFETGGVIARMNVDLGDDFEQGDTLGQVDDAGARLVLDSRRADLLDAEASLDDARLDYDRRASLQGTGAVSIASIDQAENRLESAQARLAAAKAGVATARKQIDDTRLIAPFSGEVVSRSAEPSQVVGAGQPVLEVVGRDAGLEGVVAVPDSTRQSLAPGSKAEVRILSSQVAIGARVAEIGSRASSAGLFPITLKLTDPPQNAGAGQSIEVSFETEVGTGMSLAIPLTAYALNADGQAYVFLLEDGRDVVQRREVELGRISEAGIRITRGLKAGEVIVTKGVDLLVDGQQVTTIDPNVQRFGS